MASPTPASSGLNIRAVLRSPSKTLQSSTSYFQTPSNLITFKHPGYPDQFGQNVFLRLFAFDGQRRGLHHATAQLACAIVACNTWNGYFTREKGGSPIDVPSDDVLIDTEYYFYVPDSIRYPVYPTFGHWTFPHNNLPPSWPSEANESGEGSDCLSSIPTASTLTQALISRDQACLISGQRDYIERAHLCPRSEALWFDSNGMPQYNLNQYLSGDFITDDITNVIALRSDLHAAFDDRKFLITRKANLWVAHFINPTNDIGRHFHNTCLSIHGQVSPCHLLARFAWAIFPSVRPFLETGAGRAVRVRNISNGEIQERDQEMLPDEAKYLNINLRSRSSSPTKKRRAISEYDCINNTLEVDVIRQGRKRRRQGLASSLSNSAYTAKRPIIHRASQESDTVATDTSTPTRLPSHGSNSLSKEQQWPVDRDTAPELEDTVEESRGHYAKGGAEREEMRRIEALRRRWLREGRPQDKALVCCDYSAFEKELAKARNTEDLAKDRAELCWKCLGFEIEEVKSGEE